MVLEDRCRLETDLEDLWVLEVALVDKWGPAAGLLVKWASVTVLEDKSDQEVVVGVK